MAANSTINGDLHESYYSGTASSVTSSMGITVVGRTKTYNTYQDMLDDKQPGRYAYVIDASGDDSVNSGFAYYKYEEGLWQKLFEEESMDLEGGHTHTNMAVLNNIGIKGRRPTWGYDYLVRQSDLDAAIDKITGVVAPEVPDEEPPVSNAELTRLTNKFKYTFVNTTSLITLEDQTYIVRGGVKMTGQLPSGNLVEDDVAIRIIVDEKSAAAGGNIVCNINDSINGESYFSLDEAMDVTIVYDRVNKDWVVIGTTYR